MKIDSGGSRSYELRVNFSGSAGLCPTVNGLDWLFKCGNDHDRISLKKILEKAVEELEDIGKVGR